jgi:hypothetical protein
MTDAISALNIIRACDSADEVLRYLADFALESSPVILFDELVKV